MMRKQVLFVLGLLIVTVFMLAACNGSTSLTRAGTPWNAGDISVGGDTTPPDVSAGVTADVENPASGEDVTFSIAATDDSDGNLTYAWDDGGAGGTFTGEGSEVTWSCDTDGTYTITVTVTDGSGNSSSATFEVTVGEVVEDTTPPDLGGGITADSTTVVPGDPVALSVTATDDSGGDLTYAWDDGGAGGTFTGEGAAVTWSCDTLGVYTITVTVTDPSDNSTDATIEITVEEALSQFEAVRVALEAYLTDATPVIKADALFDRINDGDPATTPFVLSVRAAEAFDIGHIPGAVNIPWKTVANTDSIAQLSVDDEIVAYCYTGHTGQVATTILSALGFDVLNLKYGMTSWTQNPTVRIANAFRDGIDSNDFPVETTENTLPADNEFPVLDVSVSTDPEEIARAAAEAYLTRDGMAPVISAQSLFDLINDGDPANDPVIVSVRGADHYALGHIPGAINIPWTTIADCDNLSKLPTDRQIVVYCYTGHTGQAASTALNMLGYDAVNMKFGMMAWTEDATVRVASPFTEGVDSFDYPFDGVAEQFETVRQALDDYFDSEIPPVITANAVFDALNDGDPATDPFVVSVRGTAHYEIGHVPSAINIPWKELADPVNLALLPTDQSIVTYCYTGHTGQIANTILSVLGFDSANMKYGIMSWTQDAAVRVATPFRDGIDSNDFAVETTENTLPATNAFPLLDVSESSVADEIALASAEEYLTRDGMAPTISAAGLFDLLNDGDPANDPLVVSVRSADHYALGHIPGAVNIPWRSIAKPENLMMLPTDRQIVVYCYTGHTGQATCTALNLLGYDAVNMKFGMMAWTEDAAVRVASPFTEGVDSNSYPFNVGPTP